MYTSFMIDKKSNIIQLKKYYQIITGYTFRGATPESDGGNLYLVQASDLSSHFFITKDILPRIEMDKPNTEAFAHYNDVVVSSRGNIEASIIKSGEENILVSSSVFILRPKTTKIINDYLAIYFNSTKGQHSLERFFSSGSIKSITKSDLADIEVPIPTMKQQKVIVNTHKNLLDQKDLLEEKININNDILNTLINKFNK